MMSRCKQCSCPSNIASIFCLLCLPLIMSGVGKSYFSFEQWRQLQHMLLVGEPCSLVTGRNENQLWRWHSTVALLARFQNSWYYQISKFIVAIFSYYFPYIWDIDGLFCITSVGFRMSFYAFEGYGEYFH